MFAAAEKKAGFLWKKLKDKHGVTGKPGVYDGKAMMDEIQSSGRLFVGAAGISTDAVLPLRALPRPGYPLPLT